MLKVDLITGFLGAGKTTLIRRYLAYLKSLGLRALIIENEFGPASVDSRLLAPDIDDHCDIADLTGMCMCCVGKDEFIDRLCDAAAHNYDRVIVEPSGIYDVDEFFSVMESPLVETVCEIGAVVTVVDASDTKPLTPEVAYLSFCQLAASGLILVSKTDRHPASNAAARIADLMNEFAGAAAPIAPVIDTPWADLPDAFFADLMNAGCNRLLHERMQFSHTETFTAIALKPAFADRRQLESKLRRLFRAAAAGRVFRVKGVARDAEGNAFDVNCTPATLSVTPCPPTKPLLIVIGQSLNEDRITHMLT